MGSPPVAGERSDRARMCVLLRMYWEPPRTTSEPSVPPQHVMVLPLVEESLAFPPLVPRFTGTVWAPRLAGITVTVVEPLAEALACETAVTVTVVVVLPPEPLD